MFTEDNTTYKVKIIGTQGIAVEGDKNVIKSMIHEYLEYYGIKLSKYFSLFRLYEEANEALNQIGRPGFNLMPVYPEELS